MRVLACLLLSALLIELASGAALIRFINTVPTRLATDSLYAAGATLVNGRSLSTSYTTHAATRANQLLNPSYTFSNTVVQNLAVDRVGIQYSHSANENNLTPPEVVWTETLAWLDARDRYVRLNSLDEKLYYWAQAMPPLRAYHKTAVAGAARFTTLTEAADTDRIAELSGAGFSRWHYYEHSQYKADGVGLYMSFAPGSYKIEAYGVQGLDDAAIVAAHGTPGTAPFNHPQAVFPTSRWDFTFEDNKVYTMMATGEVNWSLLSSAQHSVRLKVIEENLAPAPFGKAGIRFFHAVQFYSSDIYDVYDHQDTKTANKIVSSLPFEGLSASATVEPGVRVFPLGLGTQPNIRVVTGTTEPVEIRAGMRATFICAQTSSAVQSVFCRMIPSRVVAYVRLVNDMAGYDGLVQGKLGPQKFSQTPLTLWGSYEQPDVFRSSHHGSRNMGLATSTGTPVGSQGMYPVVSGIAAGSVSGYGEVFVPVYIMDFAVRPQIWLGCQNGVELNCADSYDNVDAAGNAVDNTQGNAWYEGAPIYKRVSMVIKTDGFSTINAVDRGVDNARVMPVNNVAAAARAAQPLTLRYVEPGAYYSVFVTPKQQTKAANGRLGQYPELDTPYSVKVGMSTDRTVQDVFQGIDTQNGQTRAILHIVQFDGQQFDNNRADMVMTLTPQQNHQGPKVHTFKQATAGDSHDTAYQDLVGIAGTAYRVPGLAFNTYATRYTMGYASPNKAGWTKITLEPDQYQYQFPSPPAAANVQERCQRTIPQGKFTLEANTVNYLFVMNQYGCQYDSMGNARTEAQTSQSPGLNVLFVTAGPAGSAPSSTPIQQQQSFFGSASASQASLTVLFAAVMAVMALLY